MKSSSHRKTNTVGFHLHEVHRVVTTQRQKVDPSLPGAEGRGNGEVLFNRYRISILQDEKVLEIKGTTT